jgi:hypothetical protein
MFLEHHVDAVIFCLQDTNYIRSCCAVYVSFRAYSFCYAILASAKCMAVFAVPEAAILWTPLA